MSSLANIGMPFGFSEYFSGYSILISSPPQRMRQVRLLLAAASSLILLDCHALANPVPPDQAVFDALFAQWDKGDSPGCGFAIAQGGVSVVKRHYGMANLEHGIPISNATVFGMASISKQFTAASILLLEKQGKLRLDDPIQTYLPGTPVVARSITIRQLLHHTSGLRDYFELQWLAGDAPSNNYTEEQKLSYLSRHKRLNFEPGKRYLYSNTGYYLLALIVEQVSRKTLNEFEEEYIFKPLGMARTLAYAEPWRIVPQQATGYYRREPDKQGIFAAGPSFGDIGLLSNLDDMLVWDASIRKDKLGINDALIAPGRRNDGSTINYAAGFELGTYRGKGIVHHNGSDGGFNSMYLRFPSLDASVLVLCNTYEASAYDLSFGIADLYLRDLLQSAPPQEVDKSGLSEEDARAFTGWYGFEYSQSLTVQIQHFGNALQFRGPFASHGQLDRISATRFKAAGDTSGDAFSFSLDTHGLGTKLTLTSSNLATEYVFTRLPVQRLSASQLKDLEGTYLDDEFNIRIQLLSRDQKLFLKRDNRLERIIEPTSTDHFRTTEGPVLQLKIRRNKRGKVEGFELDGDRVRELHFLRTKKMS